MGHGSVSARNDNFIRVLPHQTVDLSGPLNPPKKQAILTLAVQVGHYFNISAIHNTKFCTT
jgi:hypothetical protein